ncbi:hypothetical protein ACROYT_G021566 [Oculina patagonica]
MSSIGNAFVACGVVYCIDDYKQNPTTINFAYDTKTGRQWNPNIQFTNQYGYNSMVDYNPRERVLYAWDNRRRENKREVSPNEFSSLNCDNSAKTSDTTATTAFICTVRLQEEIRVIE